MNDPISDTAVLEAGRGVWRTTRRVPWSTGTPADHAAVAGRLLRMFDFSITKLENWASSAPEQKFMASPVRIFLVLAFVLTWGIGGIALLIGLWIPDSRPLATSSPLYYLAAYSVSLTGRVAQLQDS